LIILKVSNILLVFTVFSISCRFLARQSRLDILLRDRFWQLDYGADLTFYKQGIIEDLS